MRVIGRAGSGLLGLIGLFALTGSAQGASAHKQLMTERGVSPFYTQGPNWMFEGFAILNEFLLLLRPQSVATGNGRRVHEHPAAAH
jgi:hypothetical protein